MAVLVVKRWSKVPGVQPSTQCGPTAASGRGRGGWGCVGDHHGLLPGPDVTKPNGLMTSSKITALGMALELPFSYGDELEQPTRPTEVSKVPLAMHYADGGEG